MKIIEFIKSELVNFSKLEKIFFPLTIISIFIISFILNDNKIALVSAICGICYTILAGKGKISCYFIGMIGTFCYSYLAFINGFWGNLALYMFYYFPMEIVGIFKWKNHFKKQIREIEKIRLSKKERIVYFSITFLVSLVLSFVLMLLGDSKPILDGFATIFSLLGQLLTVKRCVEQWYVWFFVNFISIIMWLYAYIQGSNCLATVLMWFVYLILSVYFLRQWQKELKNTCVE